MVTIDVSPRYVLTYLDVGWWHMPGIRLWLCHYMVLSIINDTHYNIMAIEIRLKSQNDRM